MESTIVVIFIANEESSAITGVGVEQLEKTGYMEILHRGPVFWVDSADSEPCIGTAGIIQWQLTISGKLFHSGFPQLGINAMEMAMDVVHYIQSKFYETFPAHPREAEYNFTNCSTLKPTQIETGAGSINQIPGVCVVRGDVRLSPFYDIADVRIFIEQCVRDINANPAIVDSNSHGPHSKYVLESENVSGRVELKWLTGGENGIACSLESVGHKALVEATLAVKGTVAPYSVSGSLPLVRDLQEKGYDIQLCGYGLAKKYHALNECAKLSDFQQATRIISRVRTYVLTLELNSDPSPCHHPPLCRLYIPVCTHNFPALVPCPCP